MYFAFAGLNPKGRKMHLFCYCILFAFQLLFLTLVRQMKRKYYFASYSCMIPVFKSFYVMKFLISYFTNIKSYIVLYFVAAKIEISFVYSLYTMAFVKSIVTL